MECVSLTLRALAAVEKIVHPLYSNVSFPDLTLPNDLPSIQASMLQGALT
jgi:hypothetical protein